MSVGPVGSFSEADRPLVPALSTSSNSRSARLTLVLPRLMALSVAEMPRPRLANLPPAVATSQESYPRRPGPRSCPGSGIISGSRPRPRLLSRLATSAPVPSPVPVPSPIHVPIPTLAPVPPPLRPLMVTYGLWTMFCGRRFADENLRTKICDDEYLAIQGIQGAKVCETKFCGYE